MKLVFVAVSIPPIKALIQVEEELKKQFDVDIDMSIYYSISNLTKEKREEVIEKIAEADFTMTDMMGSPQQICIAVEEGLKRTRGNVVPFGGFGREYLKLGEFTPDTSSSEGMGGKKPDMAKMKKMAGMMNAMPMMGKMMPKHVQDKMNYGKIMGYFSLADTENIRNMMYLILSEYGGVKKLPKPAPPREIPKAGICIPPQMEYANDWNDFKGKVPYDDSKPLVALLYYGNTYPRDNSGWVGALMAKLQRVCNVLPIALVGVEACNDGTLMQIIKGAPKVDGVINTISFRLSSGPMGGDSSAGVQLFEELDVPHFHPFTMTRRTLDEWKECVQGATASEVMISIMLPEMDGGVVNMPVGVREEYAYIEKYDIALDEMVLIPERAEMFVNRLGKILELQRKANKDKKIAILCYNYPPGEDNLFGGAFLDTLESVSAMLKSLKEAGYTTEETTAAELKDIFLSGKMVNSPKYGEAGSKTPVWDKKSFTTWFKNDPAYEEMEKAWGKPTGEYMTDDDGNLLIPGVQIGNVWIGLQPSRGEPGDTEAYHDKTRPPHYQYVAYYKYIKEVFGADAMVHVGTHGTLEFLKGKEAGMTEECWPDRLVSDIPHFYLYYCGNAAEAIIAKRRSNAMLVSYMPPVFTESGLYDDYKKMDDLLQELEQAERMYPAAVPELQSQISELAEQMNLPDSVNEIETIIYRMKHSLIPYGLHVFGQAYSKEEAEQYAAQCEYENKEELAARASTASEMESLLHALNGRYIKAGIGGDIYRTPEVLPSGKNLYQFDQRLVPSPTAMKRGAEIARQTLARFDQAENKLPESVAVIMWGLETSRTQGETMAQVLTYWGVRCVRKGMGIKRYEVIPLEELGRPRIDVTVNICGFFRDMFPTLIDEISDLAKKLANLDEPDSKNFIKAHAKQIYANLIKEGYDEDEAHALSVARIFGPEGGSYGTGLTGIIEGKNWETEQDLGNQFLTSLRHVYSRDLHGKNYDGLYEQNLMSVEIVSQIRDNQEYEITDLDHYYEFFGGLSKSVEIVRGKKAQMFVTDTTGREVVTGTANEAIQNGLRRRILNPKWMEGLLKHDYHGAQKIAERFENIMGLAATTNAVDNWMFNDLHKTYVENEDIRRKMIENNSYAYMSILEQMLEYYNRKYWDATDEQIQLIKDIYLELENALEEES